MGNLSYREPDSLSGDWQPRHDPAVHHLRMRAKCPSCHARTDELIDCACGCGRSLCEVCMVEVAEGWITWECANRRAAEERRKEE